MKRFVLIFVCLLGGYLYGQSIEDYGTYVQFNSTTDTVVIYKDKVAAVWPWGGQVSLIRDAGPLDKFRGTDQALYRVNPTYYGYTTVWECFNVIAPMFGSAYTVGFGYTNDTLTAGYYIIGTDTVYTETYGYTDGNLTSVTTTQ